MNRVARSLAVPLALLGLLGLLAAPGRVLGHAELVEALPAPGALLTVPPAEIRLTFSEAVDSGTANFRLLDANGRLVPEIGPIVFDATGVVVTLQLPELAPGTYAVDYQLVSADDGHATAGRYLFLVDPTGLLPPPTTLATFGSPPANPLLVASRWLALLGGLLMVGISLVWLLERRRARSSGRDPLAVPWGTLAIAALMVFAGLAVNLTLAAAASFGPGGHPGHQGLIPLDFAAPFGFTPFGNAMRLALAASFVALWLAVERRYAADDARAGRLRRSVRRESWTLPIAALLSATILFGLAQTGHGAALNGPLGGALDWLHMLGVGVWLGSLPAFGLLALAARRAGEPMAAVMGPALRAHAPVAMAAGPVVVMTGVLNALTVVGPQRELLASVPGNLVLGKVVLVSLALAIGAVNFLAVRGGSLRRVAWLATLEVGVAVTAVTFGAVLVSVPAAVSRQDVYPDPTLGVAQLYAVAGETQVQVAVIVPAPGDQRYSVTVADMRGVFRADVEAIELRFIPPPGSGRSVVEVQTSSEQEPWLWQASGDYTPQTGDWQVVVEITRPGATETTSPIPLRVDPRLPSRALPPPDIGLGVLAPLAQAGGALPVGGAGWLVPLGLLAAFAAATLAGRRANARSGWPVAARVVLAVGVAVSGVALTARDVVHLANHAPPAAAAETNPLPDDPELAVHGGELYLANCASCHGTSGAGDGPAARSLPPPGPGDLRSAVPELRDGELAWLLAAGQVGTRMPTFGATLLESERWEIVAYLRARWPYGAPSGP